MIMFDEENCFRIWNILSSRFERTRKAKELFELGTISSEEFQKIASNETKNAVISLKECNLDDIQNFVPQIKKEIEEILDSPEARDLESPKFLSNEEIVVPESHDTEINEHKKSHTRKKKIR